MARGAVRDGTLPQIAGSRREIDRGPRLLAGSGHPKTVQRKHNKVPRCRRLSKYLE